MDGSEEDENSRLCIDRFSAEEDMTLDEYERARQCMQRAVSLSILCCVDPDAMAAIVKVAAICIRVVD